ncbi:MAG: hypothetical protein ACKOEI_04350, partial [Chthoniobacterales bacterium]
HVPSPGTPPMAGFALLGSHPLIWRSAMTFGVAKDYLPLDKLQPEDLIRNVPSPRSALVLPSPRMASRRSWRPI